ncbi:hypothetical protein CR513_51377, partial [Mucuna pruriens]
MPPDPRILRLKDWLSRYDFLVKHIKRKHNLIPYLLSRPGKIVQMITTTHSFPLIFMVKPLPNKAKTCKVFPPGLTPSSTQDILEYAKSQFFYFIHETMKYKITAPFMFNPNNPFGGVFELFCDIRWDLCEPTLWTIWCKTVQYSIPIALRTKASYDILMDPQKENSLFWTLLEWFSPLDWWREELRRILIFEEGRRIPGEKYPPLTSIIIVHRPYFQHPNGQIWSNNGTFEDYPLDESYKLQLSHHLRKINSIGTSSQRTPNPYPFNRLIPSSSNTQEIKLFKSTTEYYVPEENFQKAENLSDQSDN